jgi:hypothetical protein
MDLVHVIEKNYLSVNGEYKPMDWAHVAQYFAIDVLSDVAFSKPLEYLKNNADIRGYIKTVRQYMPVLELQSNFPLINTVLGNSDLKKITAPAATDTFGLGKMMGLAKEVVNERFGADAKVKNDMLGSFVKHMV